MNEQEQVTRAQTGDVAAWHELMVAHQTAVFRLAYLLLHDADDAADVAQECFIRAYRALDRFDAARPLRPWLLEITRNLCSNWRRALRRRWAAWQRWGAAAPDPMGRAAGESVDAAVLRQWQATQLWQAVRRLPARDQEIIYLRCFLELPVEETAAVLNIASGTVKSRLWRALDRLRGVVEQDFPELRPGIGEEVTL